MIEIFVICCMCASTDYIFIVARKSTLVKYQQRLTFKKN